ncbi:MAG: hypothetical protein ABEI74_01950 [Candidatus Pacearchaeota archaeon]
MELIIWFFAGLCFLGLLLSIFFLLPFLVGAPYEPSRGKDLDKMVEFSKPEDGDKIAELGSGDGGVCIRLAESVNSGNIEIHGYELNPFLVWISRLRVRRKGLRGRAFIHWKNFFKVDLGGFNKVVLFQFKTVMRKISRKFNKELKTGSRIVSHEWRLPGWKIKKKWRKIYLYET